MENSASTLPSTGIVPKHSFVAKCQLERCGRPLGGFYLPQKGAVVWQHCRSCGLLSAWHSTDLALVSYLVHPNHTNTPLDKKTGRPLSENTTPPPPTQLHAVRKKDG